MSNNPPTAPVVRPSVFDKTQEIIALSLIFGFLLLIAFLAITGSAQVSALLSTLGTIVTAVVAFYFANKNSAAQAA